MTPFTFHSKNRLTFVGSLPALALLMLLGSLFISVDAQAQTSVLPTTAIESADWRTCQSMKGNATAQLACFQNWASSQTTAPALSSSPSTPAPAMATAVTPTAAPATENNPSTGAAIAPANPLPALNAEAPDGKPIGCKNSQYSELSKFWELQRGTDCDTFALRGYRPTSLAVEFSDGANTQPYGAEPDHMAPTAIPYKHSESKIQVSIRTKIAKGLLKSGVTDDDDQDSLWFGYTAESYWQVFSPGLSRPFRNTDHEPELIYIYPHQIPLFDGWNYRLSSLGLVHQSNGQSLPLSRSWNRVYLMGAAEKALSPESSLTLQGRVWERLREAAVDDDNPGIENYIGRAELTGSWKINKGNTVGVTLRNSLRKEARGSTRLDWMISPSSSPDYTGLRYHVQLFSGYGDSLVDYNRRRNVLSIGLSLVDW